MGSGIEVHALTPLVVQFFATRGFVAVPGSRFGGFYAVKQFVSASIFYESLSSRLNVQAVQGVVFGSGGVDPNTGLFLCVPRWYVRI